MKILMEQVLERIDTLAQALLPLGKIRYIGYYDVQTGDVPVFCSSNLSQDETVIAILSSYPDPKFARS